MCKEDYKEFEMAEEAHHTTQDEKIAGLELINDELEAELTNRDLQIAQLKRELIKASMKIAKLGQRPANRMHEMPDEYYGKIHNGSCTFACDMFIGHCACGAAHNPSHWLRKIVELERIIVEAKACVNQDQKRIHFLQDKLEQTKKNLHEQLGDSAKTISLLQERRNNLQYSNDELEKSNQNLRKRLHDIEVQLLNARQGTFGFMIRPEESLQEGMARNYNEFNEERDRLCNRFRILREMLINQKLSRLSYTLCWCDSCKDKYNEEHEIERIGIEIDALLLVKEAQNAKAKEKKNDD